MEDLKYPIGKFDNTIEYTVLSAREGLEYLEKFPEILRELVENLNDDQLNLTYRPDGWNIRQVVHHIADSHSHVYIRTKFALSEDNPTIKGYSEGVWAEMADSLLPVEFSVKMIEGLHARLVFLLKNASDADFEKTYYHNGYNRTYVLRNVINLYVWHSKHHLEHIKIALANA